MNCFNHPDKPAVAQCPDCGRGLCIECATVHEPPVCARCFQKRTEDQDQNTAAERQITLDNITAERKAILKEMIGTALFGIIIASLLTVFYIPNADENVPSVVFWCMAFGIFAGIPAAWQVLPLNTKSLKKKVMKDEPQTNNSLPFIWFIVPLHFLLYVVYFFGFVVLFKLFLSFFIGIFILPFRTYRNIKRLNELKKMQTANKNDD